MSWVVGGVRVLLGDDDGGTQPQIINKPSGCSRASFSRDDSQRVSFRVVRFRSPSKSFH